MVVGTGTDQVTTTAPAAHARRPREVSSRDAALWVFIAVEIGAFALWMWLGRHQWFWTDEWSFLAKRTAFDLHDLFADHGNHWKTLPILVYRALWWTFGIRTYIPYLFLVVLSHLTVAALLRVVMRHLGVGPWIATAAASLFALFGAGHQNIVQAFQIGLNAAVAFGLVQILVADRDGPLDRRDWLGVGAGLASVMCAGAGVAMVAAAGLVALVRRGWRVALVHAGVPGAATLTWWAVIGREGHVDRDLGRREALDFIRRAVQSTFDSLGQLPGLGVVLGALLVTGLALAWAPLDRATLRRRAAVPVALMLAALVYLAMAGGAGAFTRRVEYAYQTHFHHVVAALVLPALAVALEAFARRWPVATPVLCVLLLVPVPGNIDAMADFTREREPIHRAQRQLVLAAARTQAGQDAPADATINPDLGPDYITVGWLRGGIASGRIPRPSQMTERDEQTAAFQLSFLQSEADGAVGGAGCERLTRPLPRSFERGDTIRFDGGPLQLAPAPGGAPRSAARRSDPKYGTLVTITADHVDAVLMPSPPFPAPTVCVGEG